MKNLNITLEGKRVKLLPLSYDHIEGLYLCGRDESIWNYLPARVSSVDEMRELVNSALKMKETGLEYPFTVSIRRRI